MGLISNEIKRDELKPGDHIYSYRFCGIYSHHGIYVGGDRVIHFTISGEEKSGFSHSSSSSSRAGAPCKKCGYHSGLSGVISTCLDCFINEDDLRLFEYGVSIPYCLADVRITCTLAHADPVEEVLYRAYYLLRHGFAFYDLFENNCADFAIYCKTGLVFTTKGSGTFGNSISIGATTVALFGLPGLGLCLHTARRLAFDIGFRKDVRKVPVEELLDFLNNRK